MTEHDRVAGFLARIYKTTHNRKGVDIVTPEIAIEVESYETVEDAKHQLALHIDRPVSCAGADKRATNKALRIYRNTDIGVMNHLGKQVSEIILHIV